MQPSAPYPRPADPAAGMTVLSEEQIESNLPLFGHRQPVVRDRPEIPNRRARRALRKATR